jgi:hypothetical protein
MGVIFALIGAVVGIFVYHIATRSLRQPPPPETRRRPFDNAFDRAPREFGKRERRPSMIIFD